MTQSTIDQLGTYGPERCEQMSLPEAEAWCLRYTRAHRENFTVLSRLLPARLTADFAAVYAFCRWSDDLGDETGDPDRATELLRWWGEELEACLAGERRHPIFLALGATIDRHELPGEPFGDLLSAFRQDQTVDRYDTWTDLLDYCRRSANPVGRIVLMVCGEPRDPELFEPSDAICTALQLTNHWQHVRRDLEQRDRIYIPRELIDAERFEERLEATLAQGFGIDHAFLAESRVIVRRCCERTWPLFEAGARLIERVRPEHRAFIWLFAAGGQRVLQRIGHWNYETVLHRPRLGPLARLGLLARARLGLFGIKGS